jgi:hypothetical protein
VKFTNAGTFVEVRNSELEANGVVKKRTTKKGKNEGKSAV